jgi:predicted DNA-binding transcriptional regulator AlpA
MDIGASTIEQFCTRYSISRATFYNLLKAQKGPRLMRIGSTVRISDEAALEWQRARESDESVAA